MGRAVGALVAPWVLWSGVHGRALELSPLGVVLRGACAFHSFCSLAVRVKGAHRRGSAARVLQWAGPNAGGASERHQELLIRDRVPLEFRVCQAGCTGSPRPASYRDAIAATDKTTTTSCARCLILSRRRSRTTILYRESFGTWTHHEPTGRFQGGNSV